MPRRDLKSKSDLTVEQIATNYLHQYGTEPDRQQIKRILFSLAKTVQVFTEFAAEGQQFKLPNLLTLEVRKQPERNRHNPKTGEKFTQPACRKLHVKFAKALRKL